MNIDGIPEYQRFIREYRYTRISAIQRISAKQEYLLFVNIDIQEYQEYLNINIQEYLHEIGDTYMNIVGTL